MQFIKRYIWWVVLGLAFYGLMSYHLIFAGTDVKFLKKSKLTLNYTFFSVKGKSVKQILDIDELRYDGIGEILLEFGIMTEEELDKMLLKYEG